MCKFSFYGPLRVGQVALIDKRAFAHTLVDSDQWIWSFQIDLRSLVISPKSRIGIFFVWEGTGPVEYYILSTTNSPSAYRT